MSPRDTRGDVGEPRGPVDPLAVLELLEDRGAPFPTKVAAYLDSEAWLAAHAADPDSADVVAWAGWVAQVARIQRGTAVVGARAPRAATTLAAITGWTEGQLLISLAETRGRLDIVELLEGWLAELYARGSDGAPLHEDPTGAHAAVVHLADRTPRTRRTP